MWKTVELADVCDLITCGVAKRPDYVETGIPFLSAKNVKKQKVIWDDYKHITPEAHRALTKHNKPEIGDVLYTRVGSFGEAAIVDKDVEFSIFVSLTLIKPKPILLNKFLIYYLNSPMGKSLAKKGVSSSGVGNLNVGVVRKFPIPLPPLAEQQRIVAKLDAAFAEINVAIEVVKNKMIEISSLYENSITAEFININGCVEKKLSDVCEKITDGTHQTPKYFEEGYIFLSSKNVTSRKIDWENVRYIDESQHIQMQKRIAPRQGDVLLAKNGTTGVAAIVDRDVVFDIYVSLAWLRSKGDVLPEYLLEYVNSKMAREQFNTRTKGIGVPNLHLQEIREVVIRFPKDKEKQKVIVKKLKNIDDACNSYKQLNEQKLQSLVSLKSAILAQELQSEAE